jgi:putative ABC transport system permease protein
MRVVDIIKISQRNLLRSKLRTFLTIAAVFIGALTLSLTNGLGNGIKAYANTQLGNLGARDTLVIEAKQAQASPVSNDVKKYNPDRQSGTFDRSLINDSAIKKIENIPGILHLIPEYSVQLEYVTTGGDKYQANATQYIEGLNLEMKAGRTVDPNSLDEMTLPSRYIKPGAEQDALGKYAAIAFKNSKGEVIEMPLKVVGIQQQSLLGNSALSISSKLAQEINRQQTSGVLNLSGSYMGAFAKYDTNYSSTEITQLKQRLDEAGFSGKTLEDNVGTIGKVINTILIVLNIFAAITLLAAGFGIINTLLMSVNERTSEIGLMKALGANRRAIFAIFAVEAASIGFWGALLGVVVSIGLGTIASSIATQSFLKDFVGFKLLAFPLLPSLGVLVGIMFLAFVAGALPSLKASKLDPISALRYE